MAKGNKHPHPPMVMKRSDVMERLRLLNVWDFQCIICGHGFRDISSVTFEHLVPKSLGGRKSKKRHGSMANFAPSHYNCNQFRKNFSLIHVARLINRHRKRLGDEQFFNWINKAVPHRIIPDEFINTPVCKPDFLRATFGVFVPDWLPGMP